MKSYQDLKACLNSHIPYPANIPVAYILGDTGSGKSTFIRQLLGTTSHSFPSTRRIRTTVAPTEYVISPNVPLRATFILKSASEILRHLEEILEDAITSHFEKSLRGPIDENDLVAALGESADQRFRLRYITGDERLLEAAQAIGQDILPNLAHLIGQAELSSQSRGPIIEWELKRSLNSEFMAVRDRLNGVVLTRIREVCSWLSDEPIQEVAEINGDGNDIPGFIDKVKEFLGTENSISPIVERARISGNLRAPWLPSDMEFIVIDSEGIGHNLQDQTLSGRHLDHFYDADAILLIDDGSKAFVGQAKNALRAIIENGYSPKLFLIFTHLDQVDGDGVGRAKQVQEVFRALRNAEQALRQQGGMLSTNDVPVSLLGEMNKQQPDAESQNEILRTLSQIREKHNHFAGQFIAPVYNYNGLAEHLSRASHDFRECWDQYLNGDPPLRRPWQSVKAFNKRMCWGEEEYQDMKPVAQLHQSLLKNLEDFLSRPDRWSQPIGSSMQESCLNTLKQEISRSLLELIRGAIVTRQYAQWEEGMEFVGDGSTTKRSKLIFEIICNCAPQLTDEHHLAFADETRGLIQECINKC
ncbi:MAG: GTPase domain-containing protein [Blastocatellia bacterium]|nr:GTPase domain-containing protein [Blastocatellia bacterium]